VGINFGSQGLELYVNGERVHSTFDPDSNFGTCGDYGSDQKGGIDGNDEPWALGGLLWRSCPKAGDPVMVSEPFVGGAIANLPRTPGLRQDLQHLALSHRRLLEPGDR